MDPITAWPGESRCRRFARASCRRNSSSARRARARSGRRLLSRPGVKRPYSYLLGECTGSTQLKLNKTIVNTLRARTRHPMYLRIRGQSCRRSQSDYTSPSARQGGRLPCPLQLVLARWNYYTAGSDLSCRVVAGGWPGRIRTPINRSRDALPPSDLIRSRPGSSSPVEG
jgi:hypothetical protein